MASYPENGIYIIMGELGLLVTAMKKGNRWSSHMYQDDHQNILLRNFANLKEILSQATDLSEVEPVTFLTPFLDVIRSEDTTGPVTGLALSSTNKFLAYNLIPTSVDTAAVAVENIADAVTHARFVGTDPGSDEVVLIKILLVLKTLMLTPVGSLLTNESVCEIMQSCFRICFEMRLSELLRRSAEHALMDMVQLLFSRLPQFSEDVSKPGYFSSMNKKLKMRTGSGLETSSRNHKRKRNKDGNKKMPNQTADGYDNDDVSSVLDISGDQVDASTIPTPPDSTAGSPIDSAIINHSTRSNNIQLDKIDDGILPDTLKNENVKPTLDLSIPSDTQIETSKTDLSLEQTERSSDVGSSELVEDMQSFPSMTDVSTLTLSTKDTEYVNPQGVRFTPAQSNKTGGSVPMPYGLPCVKELFRFLVSLTSPIEKNNTDVMTHIGLTLLTVALESGADHIGNFKSLTFLVKDDMCRNLFSLLNSERLSVFGATVRVSFLLFESMRTHLKLQLEMYLTRLMTIIICESQRVSYEQREIALDSVVQLWKIPGLVTELYLNYDCDLYCSNLFEDLTKLLSKNTFPVSGLYSTHLLSLDALLTVVDCIESNCHSRILHDNQLTSHQEGFDSNVDSGCKQSKLDASFGNGNNTTTVLQASGYQMANLMKQLKEDSNKDLSESQKKNEYRRGRIKISENIPSHETLMAIKHRKKLLATGTEHFNVKASKGISFLLDNGLLSDPLDPHEVAIFLKENPKLDKKMIGEYISNKKNQKVLEVFVRSFSFESTRLDEALRMYLEVFRLPGEAPVISLLLEHFADHWHKSNNEPFANCDAAFTLAYAIIMLNVDQHNHNVKKQSTPMTIEEFKKNVSRVNGGQDFNQDMLEDVYIAIKHEEIVMPAEQTGIVRENYLWKVLLKRGKTKDGTFIHAPNGLYDHDLFSLIWGPTVAALSFVFDKGSHDASITRRAISGFRKCAMISAHYGMSDVFDNLIISLLKFTTLLNFADSRENLAVTFGNNFKSQLAAKTVFALAHRHGDILREGWKNILDCVLQLFKAKLLPKSMVEAEDFVHPRGMILLLKEEIPAQRAESGLLSSFYSYITLTSDAQAQRGPSVEDEAAFKAAETCIHECQLDKLITESKFLRIDSLQELVKGIIFASRGPDAHVSSCGGYDEESTVFFLELLIKVVIQNRDRVGGFWMNVRDHMYSLVMGASASDHHFLMERSVVGILRLAIRLLRKEEMAPQVLQSLRMLLLLKPQTLLRVSRQISFALHQLLRTNAANIHSSKDWSTIFTLLECVGAGCKPPKVINSNSNSENEASSAHIASMGGQSDSELNTSHRPSTVVGMSRGYTSDSELYNPSHQQHLSVSSGSQQSIPSIDARQSASALNGSSGGGGGWILVGKEGEIEAIRMKSSSDANQYNITFNYDLMPHDTRAFMKSCESLAFLVRDVAHITPDNFELCVRSIQSFVEASMNGSKSNTERRSSIKVSDRRTNRRRKTETSGKMQRSPSSPQISYNADDEDEDDEEPLGCYHQISIQLLDLMHTLHTEAASIFESWAAEQVASDCGVVDATVDSLWSKCWCPLLQGISKLCCDARRQVRMSAITYLQRALLVHDLQTLSALEWEACFNKVLFPLLAKLLENLNPQDPIGMEETRFRGATSLCKVFLQHLTPLLTLPTFTALWLTILDFMDKYMHADRSELLFEAIPESLKNMLLVMDTAGIFQQSDSIGTPSALWTITSDRIETFLPGMSNEIIKPKHNPVNIRKDDVPKVVEDPSINSQMQNRSQKTNLGDETVEIKEKAEMSVVEVTINKDLDSQLGKQENNLSERLMADVSSATASSPLIMDSVDLTGSSAMGSPHPSIILHSPLPNIKTTAGQLHHTMVIDPNTVPVLLCPTAPKNVDASPTPMVDSQS